MPTRRIDSKHLELLEAFILSTPGARWSEGHLHGLHRWMLNESIELQQLRPEHIERFLACPFRRPVKIGTRYTYKSEIAKYLAWLIEHGYVSRRRWKNFVYDRHPVRPFPEPARTFFQGFESSLSRSTCISRRTNLRRFHNWLDAQQITLRDLRRAHIERWLKSLKDEGLHPATRAKKIIEIRLYLRWLHERGDISLAADELLRREDAPKLPNYLPRPLPPDVDAELQRRLRGSDCRYKLGLALMRRTGIRCGELRGLEYGCIRIDHAGNKFLKVPLGKLNNERLVPIDEGTVELITVLQRLEPHPRKFLLAQRSGKKTHYRFIREALIDAAADLDGHGKITPHRLRHTFASSLLNGGMSLVGLMRLLGHRSISMTLRYAAITTDTMGTEYFEALGKIEKRYEIVRDLPAAAERDPIRMLVDVARWLTASAGRNRADKHRARVLAKRLDRIRAVIEKIMARRNR
jgi:site-specific recombinase XerD